MMGLDQVLPPAHILIFAADKSADIAAFEIVDHIPSMTLLLTATFLDENGVLRNQWCVISFSARKTAIDLAFLVSL